MATPFDPLDRPPDDSLSLFGAESESGAPAAGSQPAARSLWPKWPARTPVPAAPASRASSEGHSVEVVGPPPPSGAVAFVQIPAAGGIGFVEGVAAVQAICAAVNTGGSASAGVPDLPGLFLTASGDVVVSGPPTGDSAPRELARILNQIVAADSMPPAARLFVGKWSDSDSGSLADFSSELEYFARPNGNELLTAVYRRIEGVAGAARPVLERRVEPSDRKKPPSPKEEQKRDPEALRRWLKNHRREVAAVLAVVSAALVTGMVAWIWPSMTPVVAQQFERVGLRALTTEKVERAAAPGSEPSSPSERTATKSKTRRSNSRAGRPAVAGKGAAPIATAVALPQDEDVLIPGPSEVATLPSRSVPDLRIYSVADPEVQPPQLRSAGIPESLLRGFERRTNAVELIVSERGDVQQVRMLNEPQRMPDIMVLSRVKELLFEPAIRNGVAVRYRLTLKWDVTP
jgi:hypothetical protein